MFQMIIQSIFPSSQSSNSITLQQFHSHNLSRNPETAHLPKRTTRCMRKRRAENKNYDKDQRALKKNREQTLDDEVALLKEEIIRLRKANELLKIESKERRQFVIYLLGQMFSVRKAQNAIGILEFLKNLSDFFSEKYYQGDKIQDLDTELWWPGQLKIDESDIAEFENG